MRTELTTVTGTMYVYAVPKPAWEIEKLDAGELPFNYQLKSYDYDSDDESVRVCEFPCTGVVPAGIDLVMRAIEGLKEKIVEVQADADKKIERYESKIKALALIEYKPDVIEVTAESDEPL